ncbi:galactokinase [Atopobacter sp. AH10]|uniref:galactokinase n=1 Tax=Atopobacter sp. AH10 TaxID=2315861 RepID=UPI000EF27524|nr:galactokinase [Atopobacter sp. AH10]RLK64265.1 galactokinase [Atopobacter sp. AH10]
MKDQTSLLAGIRQRLRELSHHEVCATYFAPGRVNLIGEHTDYNGGHVFPCAISQGTYAVIVPREDKEIHCYSENFADQGVHVFDLESNLIYREEDDWSNFVKGVFLYVMQFLGKSPADLPHGLDIVLEGNIPNGAGLSSSASIELLIACMMNDHYALNIDRLDLIKIGQKVENKFIGVNCGIMDQFAVGMGRMDQAIFLDTNSLAYDLVPAQFGDYLILIMNTNKQRRLVDSKYNERRHQCEQALSLIQENIEIESLGDLTPEMFEEVKGKLTDPLLVKRAKHAVYENQRTIEAKEALSSGDLRTFGQLMNASHISLRDDYEVTGIELDTLAETAWTCEGVLGARMTGAGMGGCAIALVHKEKVEEAMKRIDKVYIEKIGYAPSFYLAQIGDGAKKMDKGV